MCLNLKTNVLLAASDLLCLDFMLRNAKGEKKSFVITTPCCRSCTSFLLVAYRFQTVKIKCSKKCRINPIIK